MGQGPAVRPLRLYTRRGCPLCCEFEQALRVWLAGSGREVPLEILDIDRDAELRERYNAEVPLLMLGDELVLQYFFETDRMASLFSREP